MSLEPHGELVPVGGGDPSPLIRSTMTLGRRESCDIPLRFPNVSGLHAELSFRDGYWYIRDLNSTNGIKVNGTRVQEKLIHPKDEISIGKRVYVIDYELPAGRRALEELEEGEDDILSQALLERAGLERPKSKEGPGSKSSDPRDLLLGDEE